MKQLKGCCNPDCVATKKKMAYRDDDRFCTKCGQDLVFVCKKCRMPLPEGSEELYCVRCEAEREDKKDKRIDTAKKVGEATISLATVAIGIVSGGRFKKRF